MTKTATLTPTLTSDKTTNLLASFDFHTIPFTTDDHLCVSFLDEALAGLLSAALARMSAALTAPSSTGKTALLRRLPSGQPEARCHVHDVEVTGLSKRHTRREIAIACGAAPADSHPMRVRRLRPRLHARRRS